MSDKWNVLNTKDKIDLDKNSFINTFTLDSLYKVKTKTSDSFKDFFNIDTIQGIYAYYIDALMKSDIPIKDQIPYVASACQDMGVMYLKQNKIIDAKDILESGLKFCQIVEDENYTDVGENIYKLRMALCEIYYQIGDTTSSLNNFSELISITKEAYESDKYINQSLYSEVLTYYARYLNKIGMIDESDKYYNESIDIVENDSLLLFDETLQKLSNTKMFYALDLIERNEFDKAERLMNSSLYLKKKQFKEGNLLIKYDIVNTLISIANYYKNRSQFENSRKYWEELLDFIKNEDIVLHPNYVYSRIETLNSLAEIFISENKILSAKERCFEAILEHEKLACEKSDKYLKVKCVSFYELAYVYYMENKIDSSIICFNKCKEIKEKVVLYGDKIEKEDLADFLCTYAKFQLFWKEYKKSIQLFRDALKIYNELAISETIKLNSKISIVFGSLSWVSIFAKRFQDAENFASNGLSVDSTQIWINTNLAHSLLFQGNYESAKKIYIQLKDNQYPSETSKTFKDVFIQDLDEFEKAGITHPDIARIRELLK